MKGLGLLLILLPILAFSISKVGNSSIGSDRTGFEVQMPYPFLDARILKGTVVRLNSIAPEQEFDPIIGFVQSYLEVKDYDEMYPDHLLLSRQETRDWFIDHGWTEVESNFNCLFAAKIEKPTGITVVTSWGPSIGAVFYGPNRTAARKALEQIPGQINLKNGNCLW
ncbi:MAG: hypothetical protein ACXWC9_05870 [Pseudobdellovibrionaceae bacterium]